jgi:hypothetical protein
MDLGEVISCAGRIFDGATQVDKTVGGDKEDGDDGGDDI